MEESRVLSISSLPISAAMLAYSLLNFPLSWHDVLQKEALVPGVWTSGSWCWTYGGADKPHATIGYEADLTDQDNAWLRLHYWKGGEPVDYKVALVTTTPNFGGHRWWFLCPLVRHDGGPERRVAKLYLPPGGKYFGSREGMPQR